MSEHTQSQTLARENYDDENDPLAELARIVAGEPEPTVSDEPQIEPVAEQVQPVSADLAPDPFSDVDQAIDEAAGELQSMLTEASAEPQAASTNGVDTEAAFQDALISELEDEINGSSVASVAEEAKPSQAVSETPKPFDQTASEPVDTVADNIEDQLANALGLELSEPAQNFSEQEPDPQPQPQFPIQSELPPQPELQTPPQHVAPVVEEEIAQPQTEAYQQPEVAEIAQPQAVAEEDLGAAFANEFEQLLEQAQPDPQPEAVVPEAEYHTPVQEAFDPIQHEHPEAISEQPASQDLDFGSMFAEELGVDGLQGIDGWNEQDNLDAQQDFSRAVTHEGDAQSLPADEWYGEQDPGHTAELALAEGVDPAQQAEPAQVDSKKYAIAALVIALFAGTIAAGYGFLGGDKGNLGSGPQLVRADADPFKVKPDDPGGRVPANQDKASYERVAGETETGVSQDSLVSNTEEPANVQNASSASGQNLDEKTSERILPGQNSEPSQSTTPGDLAPRVVQTVTVRPDGTLVTNPALPQQTAQIATQAAEDVVDEVSQLATSVANSVAADARPVETSVIKAPEPIEGLNSTGVLPVPVVSPAAKPAPTPVEVAPVALQPVEQPQAVETATLSNPTPAVSAPALPVAKSEWVVQISSQRTAEAAQASYDNLRNRFSSVQGRPMSIQQADVNGSTFYRVRLQTESKDDANRLCSQLKAQGGSCFVSR